MVSTPARRIVLVASALALVVFPRAAGSQQSSIADRMGVRHWSGQNVAPVYEGFDINADGSYNLWFGYMNRNFEEALDVPVGPDNTFEPGGDVGQPTHFAPRRHKDTFKVVVPKDFGEKKLVWKLTVRGKTESIAGTINPVWQIDRQRTTRGGSDEAIDSNHPPVVKVDPVEQTLAAGGKATLAISATDDGLPRRRRDVTPEDMSRLLGTPPAIIPNAAGAGAGGRGGGQGGGAPENPGLSFEWFKYRGPGKVVFSRQLGMLAQGKGTATATFSEPGDYIIQVVVDDGSGESAGNFGYHCCWTNVEVKIHVTKGPSTGQQH